MEMVGREGTVGTTRAQRQRTLAISADKAPIIGRTVAVTHESLGNTADVAQLVDRRLETCL